MCLDHPALKFTVTFEYIITKVHTRLFAAVTTGNKVCSNKKQKRSDDILHAAARLQFRGIGVSMENKGLWGILR